MRTMIGRWCLAIGGLVMFSLATPAYGAPRVLHDEYQLTPYATAPQIVTPIGVTFDHQGDLLVIESHTHHRPEDYVGPAHDRIVRVLDADQDGSADRFETFFDATDQTMSLLGGSDGWVYVATRREILRLRATKAHGAAVERESLAKLITDGDYPHNGLAGLCFTPDQRLVFGLGENLGARYRLQARDGTFCEGGGEGGSLYEMGVDGSHVKRWATGFWNPFANAFDSHGRLFTVDNDPDASPPCRLLHVVPTGDYGYAFRYGRSGRHPLQAWNGELPGTLPMAAGTGEAPCQVVPYRGRLWVSSWGDHRIEAFAMSTVGATVEGQREIIVQGEADFRPVGMAITPDGSLLISDWVDKSYPVHRQGRLWKLTPSRTDRSDVANYQLPPRSDLERESAMLREQPTATGLASDDPFVRQAAVAGLVHLATTPAFVWPTGSKSQERLAILQAQRWTHSPRWPEPIRDALHADDIQLNHYALRTIADEHLSDLASDIAKRIPEWAERDARLARVAVATLAWLERGADTQNEEPLHERLASYLVDEQAPETLKQLAFQALPPRHPALTIARLHTAIRGDNELSAGAMTILWMRDDAESGDLLAATAADTTLPVTLRADAIAGLARHRARHAELLERLTKADEGVLRREAVRSLGQEPIATTRPSDDDLEGWLAQLPPNGNREAGRRIFFRATGARCAVCHAHEGRGASIGPDLETIHRRADKRWLLQAILTPSRDIGPRFACETWVTHDGRSWTGLPLQGPGEEGREIIILADGTQQSVPSESIAERHAVRTSVMPEGLASTLSVQELADLLAFLQDTQ